MLRAHDACRHTRELNCYRFPHRLLRERVKDGQELDGESFDVNELSFCFVASLNKVLVNRGEDHQIASGGVHLNKNIEVCRVERLKIIDGVDGSSDCVLFN